MFHRANSRGKNHTFAEILEEKIQNFEDFSSKNGPASTEKPTPRTTGETWERLIREGLSLGNWTFSRGPGAYSTSAATAPRKSRPQAAPGVAPETCTETDQSRRLDLSNPALAPAVEVFHQLGELAVQDGVRERALKRIFRKWARQLHPDVLSKTPENERRDKTRLFQKLSGAYTLLISAPSRS